MTYMNVAYIRAQKLSPELSHSRALTKYRHQDIPPSYFELDRTHHLVVRFVMTLCLSTENVEQPIQEFTKTLL